MNEIKEYELCIQHIKKKVVKCGDKLHKPTDGSVCGALIKVISGAAPDETLYTSPTYITVTIGDGNAVFDRVIEYCLTTMNEKEESVFEIYSVTFVANCSISLETCSFKPYSIQMLDSEKFALSLHFKNQGVHLFIDKKVDQAFEKFRKALQYLLLMKVNYPPEAVSLPDDIHENLDFEELDLLRVNIYNNLASCQLHFKSYGAVVPLCTKSILIKPNVKAYYRRAIAFIELVEYENAENDLISLLKLESNNKAALEKLLFVRSLDEGNRETYKATIRKMFA